MKYVIFDLDGTLLPMDQVEFTQKYFEAIESKFNSLGLDGKAVVRAVRAGTAVMVNNDGKKINAEVFWQEFSRHCECDVDHMISLFDDFYQNEFQSLKAYCGFMPEVGGAIEQIDKMGYTLVLASNPIFPAIAQRSRAKWAGVDPDLFYHSTTYINSCYCKPNVKFYDELFHNLCTKPQDCIMVGNDVDEDMVAGETGCDVFLLPRFLLNKHNKPIDRYKQGDFSDLLQYLKERKAD